jgi:hypothetical protein
MKPGLKRIEATLHDLKTRNDDVTTEPGEESKRSFSFRISIRPQESPENSQNPTQTRHSNVDADSVSHQTQRQIYFLSIVPFQPFQPKKMEKKRQLCRNLKLHPSAIIVTALTQHWL